MGALLLTACLPRTEAAGNAPPLRHRPELEYLKAVNTAGPPHDPQLLFLLMGQYANANRAAEGTAFFSARLAALPAADSHRPLYLAAIGLLRARQAGEVPLWKRIGWVKDTVAMLEEANRLSGGEVFPLRWIAGVVYAQLPGMFGQRAAARRGAELVPGPRRPGPAPGLAARSPLPARQPGSPRG
jgi:hypothetical protein